MAADVAPEEQPQAFAFVQQGEDRLIQLVFQKWEDPAEDEGQYVGIVKSKGNEFAYLQCPEVYAEYGKDVFLSSRKFGRQWEHFHVGSKVVFDLGVTHRGCMATYIEVVGAPMGQYQGLVKSKGAEFAYITCPEIASQYGKDVFLSSKKFKDQWGQFRVGSNLRFNLAVTEKGCMATWIQPLEQSPGRFQGTIKSKSDHFGYIHCPNASKMYGKDVFFSQKKFTEKWQSFKVGLEVTFDMAISDKGCMATWMELTSEPQGQYCGKIKSKSPQYAYIHSDEILQEYGKDVFMSSRKFGDTWKDFSVGSFVRFNMALTEKGLMATWVKFGCTPPEPDSPQPPPQEASNAGGLEELSPNKNAGVDHAPQQEQGPAWDGSDNRQPFGARGAVWQGAGQQPRYEYPRENQAPGPSQGSWQMQGGWQQPPYPGNHNGHLHMQQGQQYVPPHGQQGPFHVPPHVQHGSFHVPPHVQHQNMPVQQHVQQGPPPGQQVQQGHPYLQHGYMNPGPYGQTQQVMMPPPQNFGARERSRSPRGFA